MQNGCGQRSDDDTAWVGEDSNRMMMMMMMVMMMIVMMMHCMGL